ncbi:4-hydroxy-tetrahydrodipicolinate synthase [Streptomyces avicenniae]|uniref:4-hydroxy-tetrahydrodipicolinate synthase n=1 Tax=Streptomyces avicenniae TaxID=500153 RepID=UPI000ABEB33B|nr:4-hydroxy-tetrahydrodipicolinate synthase [Streptomyces avicenniae]
MRDAPFGRTLAAMITPFAGDGSLDLAGARRLAAHLVDRGGCDGLVVNGTGGESPTTSDAEKTALVRAVVEEVGDRASVVAGVGSADTRHTVALGRAAGAAGADGLLVVTPYYSRPTQEGIVHHLRAVADAAEVPVMLYDVPARTGEGTALTADSLRGLAEHPRVVAVKDCSFDLLKSGLVLADTDLAYYSGSDELTLPLLSIGASGVVSTVANLVGVRVTAMIDAFDKGDAEEAARLHRALLPLVDAVFGEVPATVAVKALFAAAGLPGGPVRSPLLAAGPELTERLAAALRGAVAA